MVCFRSVNDWRSYMASRLHVWRPERCVGLVLLNLAYMPSDHRTLFNLDVSLDLTEKGYGYPGVWPTCSHIGSSLEQRVPRSCSFTRLRTFSILFNGMQTQPCEPCSAHTEPRDSYYRPPSLTSTPSKPTHRTSHHEDVLAN